MNKYGIWATIFLVAALICLLFAMFVFVGSALSVDASVPTNTPWWVTPTTTQWPGYPAPPEPTQDIGYPAPVSKNPEFSFLPWVANAFKTNFPPLPTLAPTMSP